MRISRRQMLISGAAFALMPLHVQARQAVEGATMGTGYRVWVPSRDARLQSVIQATLDDVERRLSPFRADSDLSRLNAHVAATSMRVSLDTAAVIDQALRLSAETLGAFDPVVGARVGDWGLGAVTGAEGTYRDIRCDAATARVTKTNPKAAMDLCGIAKGFALDKVARGLRMRGVTRCLIEIGGEVLAVGDGWRIAVQRPDSAPGTAHSVLKLQNAAVATSGDYRHLSAAGKRYAAIIDPNTARPVDHGMASVTVIAPTATRADALATALMAMPPAQAMHFAEVHDIPALALVRTSTGLTELASPLFAHYRRSA